VIGTNKKDAQQTVDAIFADLLPDGGERSSPSSASGDRDAVEELLRARQPALVSYEGWTEIDSHERALGESAGRPRVKVTTIEEMLHIAAAEDPRSEQRDEVESG
jgi:ferredoxin--NADP+ reductase